MHKLAFCGFVGLFLSASAVAVAQDPKSAADADVLPQVSDTPRPLARDALACAEQSDIERLTALVRQDDETAFLVLESRMIAAGECKLIDLGTRVIVTDVSVWHGLVQIRPIGDPDSYWAIREVFAPQR